MNDFERLSERLRERFPTASLRMDPASTPTGSWWLDAELQGHLVVAEWKPDAGFGLSTPTNDDFGAGPDEIYPTETAAFERIKELLLGQTKTARPEDLSLPKLRELRQLSQMELASRLQVSQGALSRMERRSDILIGSLRKAIAAMGGELEIRALFPEGNVVRIHFEDLYEDEGRDLANDNLALRV
jgi:DNA-binding XRE family transcriptional regulator